MGLWVQFLQRHGHLTKRSSSSLYRDHTNSSTTAEATLTFPQVTMTTDSLSLTVYRSMRSLRPFPNRIGLRLLSASSVLAVAYFGNAGGGSDYCETAGPRSGRRSPASGSPVFLCSTSEYVY